MIKSSVLFAIGNAINGVWLSHH